MKINFSKTKISNGKERIFIPETTPCDEHPSFSMLNCEEACIDDYSITFCLAKIVELMKTSNLSMLSALVSIMRENDVVQLTNVFVELTNYSKNKYIPEKIQLYLTIKLINDLKDIELKFDEIKSSIKSRCGAIDSTQQAITNPNITLTQFYFTSNSKIYVLRDMDKALWMVRARLLNDWTDVITAKKHGIPIPPQDNENKIFVVLQPREEFEVFANGLTEGVSDIGLIDFGYDYDTSTDIYQALLENKICIIRHDVIDHPIARSYPVNVYTCVPVKLIPTILTVTTPGERVYEPCTKPIEDMLIQHMGEYKRITNVELSWGFDTYVRDMDMTPSTVNPFTETILKIYLGEKYGGILNYHLTFSSNNIDVDTSLESDKAIQICNTGCKY